MIVCRDNKWFGNVDSKKFTCNPTCSKDSLAKDEHGEWECTDKYDEDTRTTIKDYHCNFTCKDGYEPKQPTEAICNVQKVSFRLHFVTSLRIVQTQSLHETVFRVHTHTIAKQDAFVAVNQRTCLHANTVKDVVQDHVVLLVTNKRNPRLLVHGGSA